MTDQTDSNGSAVFSELLQGGLGLALESMPLGVTITDLDRRILYTNPAEASMHGYSVDELLGQPSRIFAPRGYARALPRHELGTVAPWQREAINVRRDGSTFPVRLQSRVVRSTGDQAVAIVTTCQDITDHVRSIKALRASEQRYRSFVERAAHGIYRASPEGRFLEVNPALVRMLGYGSSREVLGLDIGRDVFEDPRQRQRLLRQVRDGKYRTGIEVRWKQRDESIIDVRLSGTAIYDAQGHFEYVEMFAEDVTEHQSLLAQLRQVQKTELLGQWTGGIAHDFNNILTVIMTNAELVGSALHPEQQDLREELDGLRGAAVRGTLLVRKLLGFAKRGRIKETVDFQRTLSDLIETVRRLLPETIEVELHHGGRLPKVRADAGVVEQILLNLATNARDAMEGGGRLVFETSTRTVQAEDLPEEGWGTPGTYVCIAVRDNGIGMDAKTQKQVFEPFFTTKEPGAGTGLGLAMVDGLMKQHDGFVNIESTLGAGTEVTVYFPVTDRVDAEPEAPKAAPAPRGGSETLLIVEDEEAIRRATKRLLERQGYTVLLAADGVEALELIEKRPGDVDLVITDFVMPRMTGPQLYDAVQRRGLPTRFIMVSGYSEDADETRHASRPDVPFMRKPWVPAALLERIREVLDTAPR